MRLIAWNILQGAPRRGMQVAEAVLGQEPDVVVLSEFHPTNSHELLRSLRAAGLQHSRSAPAGYGYAVLIASRTPLEPCEPTGEEQAPVGGYLEVGIPAHDVVVGGVYAPVISAVPLSEKRRFWRMLHEAARRRLSTGFALVGDLNTGDFPADKEHPGRPFSCTPEYRIMGELGMVEAWRAANGQAREFSWRSNRGAGFRIDHAFVSPPLLRRLVQARYSHQERELRLSDHSMLIVDFN